MTFATPVRATIDHPEQCRTLWILACSIKDSDVCEAVPLYATDGEDAERQAQEWLQTHPRSPTILSLRSYPDGFVLGRERLPGMII